MPISAYNSGISAISPLEPVNRIFAVNRVQLGSRAANNPISRKPAAYIMAEAPKQFIRSSRYKNVGSYRAALESSATKDDVNTVNMLAMDATMRDLKRSEPREANYIIKYMNTLDKQKSEFMSSEKYQELSWSSVPDESQITEQPYVDAQETRSLEASGQNNYVDDDESNYVSEDESNDDNSEDITNEANKAAQPENGTPISFAKYSEGLGKTGSRPQPTPEVKPQPQRPAASNGTPRDNSTSFIMGAPA